MDKKYKFPDKKCRFSDKKLWTEFTDGCDFPKSLAAALRSQVIFKCKIWCQWWYYDSWNGFNSSQNPKQVFFNSSKNPKQVFSSFFMFFNFLKSSQTTSIQVAGKFQTTSPEGTKQDSMDKRGKFFFNFLKTHL